MRDGGNAGYECGRGQSEFSFGDVERHLEIQMPSKVIPRLRKQSLSMPQLVLQKATQVRPGSRIVTSCTSHVLPSGS